MKKILRIGIDIGSTTIKFVVLDKKQHIIAQNYERHYSEIYQSLQRNFHALEPLLKEQKIQLAITGSAGMGIAGKLALPFVQEVIACSKAVREIIPQTDTVVEIGGEDAKINFYGDSPEQRMNGVCAGGTGAFIDHMASLLKTDAAGLNKLAEGSNQVYPIASRCGVFAKTDIQALINDGVSKSDIAVSIFQAVANQIISSLAQGRRISGHVAFLGGPLSFLPELKKRFIKTLELDDEHVVNVDNGCYFVAIGAALSVSEQVFEYDELMKMFTNLPDISLKDADDSLVLFKNEAEYAEFKERHAAARIKHGSLADYKGTAYLGIDAGSTTTKFVLIGSNNEILYDSYESNRGEALSTVVRALKKLYTELNPNIKIGYVGVTGYGEHIIKAALNVDFGQVETMAHLRAAQEFSPQVDFVLDIGGQDMKSFIVKDGVIDQIMLNEACSAGCGSFIENFAQGLNMTVADFAKRGIMAKHPVDLGTRCTVFMNSKVKQAQKEGATVEDISAGIAVSVIKNALFKVIQINDVAELGENIVVQGGTFYNDAVLRAMEMLLQRPVIRPVIAGLMGAYGIAVLAKEHCDKTESDILAGEQLECFKSEVRHYRCRGCGNQCLITQQKFSNGGVYYTGNRCERGIGGSLEKRNIPNAYLYKYQRLFAYEPLNNARRGKIGIPRVLNIYENYPFWFTFFTDLGYEVVLSGKSSMEMYQLGMENVPSDSLCYPAKLSHGHIVDLVNKGIKKIFYPCIPYNKSETEIEDNCYNCPIVASYPENIRANMEILEEKGITFFEPFLPLDSQKRLAERLHQVLSEEKISAAEIRKAVDKAEQAQLAYKQELRDYGDRVLAEIESKNMTGVVLLGRPYHIDPEINHGIPELLQSYGLAVLSEDTVAHRQQGMIKLDVVNQWTFHSRLYQAADYLNSNPRLSMIQLSSFGCGLDAVTIPQLKQIAKKGNQVYTMIKLDEVNNLGAVRIRIRSLMASLEYRTAVREIAADIENAEPLSSGRSVLTAEKAKRDVILVPQMSAFHFPLIVHTLNKYGYRVEIPPISGKHTVDMGLRYVNQDICYPATIVIGQMMEAVLSGKYDTEHTAIMLFQSGGACRATNYLQLMRAALKKAGLEQVPVFACWGTEHDSFKLSVPAFLDIGKSIIYGDLLMRLSHRMRPYELTAGSTDSLYDKWFERCRQELSSGSFWQFQKNIRQMTAEFDALKIDEQQKKPRVGVVGEIMVKYHPLANNNLNKVLEAEGAEVVMPDMTDFLFYMAFDDQVKHKLLSGSLSDSVKSEMFIGIFELYRRPMRKALKSSRHFQPPESIYDTAERAGKHVSLGNMAGEGWFLTGEMVNYIYSGIENIVCLQPFACLPNHITGKGMIRELMRSYPGVNIVSIDCDAGASEVNQLNRLKLMLAVAREKLKKVENI